MEINGQITEQTERCNLLKTTIKNYNPTTIVEIGTWKGLGSTKCILDSMDANCKFVSLETNKNFYEIAKQNLLYYEDKFKLIYGTIVSEDEINEFISSKSLTNVQKTWLNEDIENIKKCSNVLCDIPEKIDLLLLDGGEFSTYNEWLKLKDRTKIVAIDDINELKTKEIFKELTSNIDYELICISNEGNGFAIFKKKI
jgi:hypothetical protein